MIVVEVRKQLVGFRLEAAWRAGCEVTVLFGPSGAGKTTLLRMMAGLECPDEGRIVVNDRLLFGGSTNIAPGKRDVGYVVQDYALFPWLTVRDNIVFGLGPRQRRQSIGWVHHLIESLRIGPLLTKWPKQLSGGEAQRVALARALAPRPALLLLDEPFSAVGGELRIQIRGLVKQLQREWNIPVIIVTHDLTEAHLVGDHLIRLEQGQVVYEGPMDGLLRRPGDPMEVAY